MEIDVTLRLRLDTTAALAFAKAVAATMIVMALLSRYLTVAEVEQVLRLLFG
jgi:hypothetical protein